MITYLKLRNLAIVEEFELELGSGLNVLTGETGAGKSLLIDSLDFLSGARGSAEMIRTGEEKMTAEAAVHVAPEVEKLFADAQLEEAISDGEIVVRREFSKSGRGRVSVNGTLFSVRELQEIMERLVEIQGQNQARDRVAGREFRQLVDEFAANEELLASVRLSYDAWKAAHEELELLVSAQKDRALRLDLLKYQIQEISAARLQESEEETLRNERNILANARHLLESTSTAFTLLDEDESSAIANVARAMQALSSLSSINEVAQIQQELEEARIRLQEVARSVSSVADSVRIDPERLDEIEERLVVIERLKKKYGASGSAILEHFESAQREFDQLSDFEASVDKLAAAENRAFDSYVRAATQLSKRRKEAAGELQKSIERELRDLAMERTSVHIEVATSALSGSRMKLGTSEVAFGPEGFDRIEFLISPNRGEELRPMRKIASGGELSRLQLAIAVALFKKNNRGSSATLVFDEIDAGIGGQVADAVGQKLRELAASNQVLCVTHLPQIASLASTHFRVWKEDHAGRTRARLTRLTTREQRVEEIARMLGGEAVAASARAHAAELLDRADAPAPRKRSGSGAVSKLA
jgi:DNA repair protein RecN (Recombination protein N)